MMQKTFFLTLQLYRIWCDCVACMSHQYGSVWVTVQHSLWQLIEKGIKIRPLQTAMQ